MANEQWTFAEDQKSPFLITTKGSWMEDKGIFSGDYLALDDFDSYVEAGTDIQADFCLRCKGDSMINARIFDGDIVFIRAQQSVNNGEIAAVQVNGDSEATLKRVEYLPERNLIFLKPENPKYDTLTYANEELGQIRIIGKAVAFQSDVR